VDCALNEHQTRNIVCCAKHHMEIPCETCTDLEAKAKEALEALEKSKTEQK
jgi:hypothetical protein